MDNNEKQNSVYQNFVLDLASLYEKYELTYEQIDSFLSGAKEDAIIYGKTQKFVLNKKPKESGLVPLSIKKRGIKIGSLGK